LRDISSVPGGGREGAGGGGPAGRQVIARTLGRRGDGLDELLGGLPGRGEEHGCVVALPLPHHDADRGQLAPAGRHVRAMKAKHPLAAASDPVLPA